MGDADVTASQWRDVEVGRVALFSAGPYSGRIAAIVQIIDHKRVLVDGPSEDPLQAVPRHAASLSYMSLTAIVVPELPNAAGTAALKKQWVAHKVLEKYTESNFAQSRQRSIMRRQLSDFERFKVMKQRKQQRFEVRKSYAAAKASAA